MSSTPAELPTAVLVFVSASTSTPSSSAARSSSTAAVAVVVVLVVRSVVADARRKRATCGSPANSPCCAVAVAATATAGPGPTVRRRGTGGGEEEEGGEEHDEVATVWSLPSVVATCSGSAKAGRRHCLALVDMMYWSSGGASRTSGLSAPEPPTVSNDRLTKKEEEGAAVAPCRLSVSSQQSTSQE
jgi:hypothetical protein